MFHVKHYDIFFLIDRTSLLLERLFEFCGVGSWIFGRRRCCLLNGDDGSRFGVGIFA